MLRSRHVISTANSQPLNNASESKPTNHFKEYGVIIAQITAFFVVLYFLYLFYDSQSLNAKPVSLGRSRSRSSSDSSDSTPNIDQIIADAVEHIIDNPNMDTDDASDIDDDTDIDNALSIASDKEFKNLPKDKCEWRPENLVGACFGLNDVKHIKSAIECKAKCCDDDECITWQYHPTKGCQNGGNVRFGLEHASTPNWCEPVMPKPWKGLRLKKRPMDDSNGSKCEWDEKELNTQCFGLGPEIRGITTEKECAEICCENKEKECEIWQWRDDKGCFIGQSGRCDVDTLSYIGQRKVMMNGVK